MEILLATCLVVLGVLIGLMISVVSIHKGSEAKVLATMRELVKVKEEFADTLRKVTEANNTWAQQAVLIEDRVMALEMVAKSKK